MTEIRFEIVEPCYISKLQNPPVDCEGEATTFWHDNPICETCLRRIIEAERSSEAAYAQLYRKGNCS